MLELAQNLILNEDALNSLPEKKRPIFIYEWLCFLNKVLIAAQKNDIRECQSHIVKQLFQQIQNESSPPIRILIGRNLATLFSVGDRSSLFNTINRCNDILKTNDEIAQLTTVEIIGALYERLGRFLGRSYEETVQLLLNKLKNGDSQMRYEVLYTFERILNGLGSVGRNIHREIYKIAKTHICDRAMSVRSAAAMCLIALINQNNFMYTSELEGNIALGFRAFDGSNYEVRCSVAKYLAILLAASQDVLSDTNQSLMNKSNINVTNIKKIKAQDIFNYLSEGFLRGNISFLKSNINEQLKGTTTIQNEIRIGVTHTYVELIRILGQTWIEQNLSLFINHLLDLVGNSRASISHIDAIFSRKCITFILRSVIGSHLSENAQFIAAKELITIITRYATSQPTVNPSLILTNDANISSLNSSINSMIQSYGSSTTNHVESHQNILICALNEFSLLIQSFGTSTFLLLKDSCNGLIDTLFLVILNPSYSVRLSVAWCFRSIGIALPSLMTPLIDKCLEKMNDLAKQSSSYNTDAMSGFALVLQALLGTVYQCPLGISSQRAKTIFDFADNLLRTAIASTVGQQQSLIPRIILQRIHTAWHLLSACCTLDQQFLKTFMPRLVLLWRNVFPRSLTDFEQEKQRGDSFTWTLSLYQRSGALCSMISFLNNYSIDEKNLLTDDLFKHILNPIENAILILFYIPNLIKHFGHQLKISTIIFRLRLFELLLLIPNQFYEQHFNGLLRELIAEFTLIDSSLNTTTSLLKSVCHDNDRVLFGNWSQETDYQIIEEQLQPHSTTSSGALEHDETYLYRRDTSLTSFNIINYLFHSSLLTNNNSSNANDSFPIELNIPGPLPLGIAVIDASICLYGNIFIRVSNKHRLNMFQHFIELIKQFKHARQEAVQINIITAVLLSLKTLAKTKQFSPIDDDKLTKCACTLIIQTLSHSNPVLRCTASEALGRLIQVIDNEHFVGDIIQFCFNHLKESRDVQSRTGYSLALGCLYRYMDSMNRRQYLNLSVPVLLSLIQDQSTTIVQVWTLHALTLIADSSGQMFRGYIKPLLKLILHLLLSTSSSQIDIYQYCGRLLSTLIIIIGPDLQTNINYISILRSLCLTASNLLQMHIEPIVQAEAIQALQQLHLFAPRHVNLSILVPELIKGLTSRDLLLRRACISCLRQLTQREAKEVCEHAKLLFTDDTSEDLSLELSVFGSLEELLFSMLDTETDAKIYSNIQDILVYMLQILGPNNLTHWLQLCKDILVNTAEKSNTPPEIDHPTPTILKSSSYSNTNNNDDDEDNDYADEQLQTITEQNSTSSTKWQTKVFAVNCIKKLINYCEQKTLHFDYISAKEHLQTYPNEDYLVIHLNTLITLSYIACKSTNDQLRLSGLSLLKQIILKFSHIKQNIHLPDHLILEQYQSQISISLRPSFSQGTSSHITIQACDVCNTWISSNIAHDLNDFRRIHQLLISSLQKFTSIQQQNKNMIYNEMNLMIENVSILKLWSNIYNFAIKEKKDNLLIFIQTELYILIHHWLAVLTDYTFLILPNQLSGNFYSIQLIKTIYKSTWTSIIQATIHWLVEHHYELEILPANHKVVQRDILMKKLFISTLSNKIKTFPEKKEEIFAMLLACCIDALSVSISEQTDETSEIILLSLKNLLQSDLAMDQITMNISIELINVLHRLYFVCSNINIHLEILNILENIFHIYSHIQSDQSFLFASLKFLVAILLNYYPNIIDDSQLSQMKFNKNDLQIIELTIKYLYELIKLSNTNQNIQELVPIILHLFLSISFILFSTKSDQQKSLLSIIIQSIENIFSTYSNNTISHRAMITIMNLRINLIEKDISDNGYFIRCLTSLIINSDSIKLTKQILNFYRKGFDDQEFETHLNIFKCLNKLFQSKNLPLRNKFIQTFTPLLLIDLKQTNNQQQIIEILKIFETLLSIIDPTLRIHLSSLIIPLFINYLPDSNSNMNLISYIIERIEYLHSIYSNEFRLIFQKLPDLRIKLENAIYRQEQKRNEKELNQLTKNSISTPLRINFSNFKSQN